MQYKGNRKNCRQISEPVRKRIKKLVKDGVFDDASANIQATKTTGADPPNRNGARRTQSSKSKTTEKKRKSKRT